MNIGSLYIVKKYFWLLFPTKETATTAALLVTALATTAPAESAAARNADCCSRACNCEVTYFSPESFIVFLQEDGICKKVLTSDGRIGWIWFDEDYISYFEEMKA